MTLARWLFRLRYGRRLPKTQGELAIAGLGAPVEIRRDEHGIAYIHAASDADAWYALGFCQGQDRAFQLELLLRTARGTLAELVGETALPGDRLARRIGFRPAAERQVTSLAPKPRRDLAAFSRGLRDGATVGCPRPAHEFALLGIAPTPYDEADALGVVMLMSFFLESNWGAELARLLILTQDGRDALLALDPLSALPDAEAALAGSAAARLAEDVACLSAALGIGGGSNVWALSGRRTASGRPLLANDPHLRPTLPPHWYLAGVRTPRWHVAGAMLVGAPGFAAGHNGHVAWGLTAGLADNTDLYVEEIGADGRSLRSGERFVPCELRRETIAVRGGTPVVEDVLVTPRGPVIGPALAGEVGAISLQATWLAPRARDGLLELHCATSVAALREALALGSGLSVNLVCADTAGTIAWQLVGDLPRRRRGWGTLPRPGWREDTAWEREPLAFDAMPHAVDPEAGFLVNANNPLPIAGPFGFAGLDWLDSYRFDRISEVLASRTDWQAADMQALQSDLASLPWREVRSLILALPPHRPEVGRALMLLRDWDGLVSPESSAATVFELFLTEMARRAAAAKAPRSVEWALGKGFTPLVPFTIFAVRRVGKLVDLLQQQPPGWLPRPWTEECADALAAVIRSLEAAAGRDPDRWRWGRVRPLVLRHPMSARKALAPIFDLRARGSGGDTNTVCQASVNPLEPLADPLYLASLRLVVDVGDWSASRFALPGGQSGNPLSPHYADLLPYWEEGHGVPLAWTKAAIEKQAGKLLILRPQ